MSNLLILTVLKSSQNTNLYVMNYWMILSLLELVLILFLLFKLLYTKKKSDRSRFKKESLNQEIDFDNIFKSSFHSKEMYDELKVKCHPDRFVGDQNLQKIAENLFQEITKNKNNAKMLLELKNEAIQKLNINF
jgi:hypothetical protein